MVNVVYDGLNLNLNSSSTESQLSRIENLLQSSKFKSRVDQLTSLLYESVKRRVGAMPKFCKKCLQDKNDLCIHSKLGILYSGSWVIIMCF